MARFKLVPYVVRIKRKYQDEFVSLNDIDGNGTDFLKILSDYLNSIKGAQVIRRPRKTISAEEIEATARDVYGLAKSGEYGIEADFYNVNTGKVIPRARREEHSETLPFFFYFHLPQDDKGLVILSMFKAFGIKNILEQTLNKHLSPYGVIVKFNRLISHNLLEKIEKSRLIELRLIRYDVPRDTADKVHNGEAEELIEERVFRIKRNRNLNLSRFLKQALTNRETTYYEILDEHYDEVKAVIEKEGSKLTLTFGDQDVIREFMPLSTKDIRFDRGFPAYNYLLEKAKGYMDHLKESFGGE